MVRLLSEQLEFKTAYRVPLQNCLQRRSHMESQLGNDRFSSGDDYGFNKTVVPVNLAQCGNEALISRSQAKRLLARVELFKTVLFDFRGVKEIGQAFADEIFRVFANHHPEIELLPLHANAEVVQMIQRAKTA